MKKCVIALACVLFASIDLLHAQEVFPLSNAAWTSLVVEYDTIKYSSFVLHGDTVINDSKRSKLWYIPNITKKDSFLIGFIHIQDKVVFFRANGGYGQLAPYPPCTCEEIDQILYDFSFSKGDSTSYYCSDDHWVYVTEVDSVELGGKMRKRINFTMSEESWIEGMGSTYDLLYPIVNIPTGASKHFLCFVHNDEVLYSPEGICLDSAYAAAIADYKTIENNLKIFPNPAKTTTSIQSEIPLKRTQIYDVNGILVHEQSCNGALQAVIQTNALRQGLYFVKITLSNGTEQTQKLIIER